MRCDATRCDETSTLRESLDNCSIRRSPGRRARTPRHASPPPCPSPPQALRPREPPQRTAAPEPPPPPGPSWPGAGSAGSGCSDRVLRMLISWRTAGTHDDWRGQIDLSRPSTRSHQVNAPNAPSSSNAGNWSAAVGLRSSTCVDNPNPLRWKSSGFGAGTTKR